MTEKKLIAISKTLGIFRVEDNFHYENFSYNNKWLYYRALRRDEIPSNVLKMGDVFTRNGIKFVYLGNDTIFCSNCKSSLFTDLNKIDHTTFYKGFCNNCGEMNFMKEEEPFHYCDDYYEEEEDDFDNDEEDLDNEDEDEDEDEEEEDE